MKAPYKGPEPRYEGVLQPAVGFRIWDPEERVWACRVREEDQPFPCGIDCCGVEKYAVIGLQPYSGWFAWFEKEKK